MSSSRYLYCPKPPVLTEFSSLSEIEKKVYCALQLNFIAANGINTYKKGLSSTLNTIPHVNINKTQLAWRSLVSEVDETTNFSFATETSGCDGNMHGISTSYTNSTKLDLSISNSNLLLHGSDNYPEGTCTYLSTSTQTQPPKMSSPTYHVHVSSTHKCSHTEDINCMAKDLRSGIEEDQLETVNSDVRPSRVKKSKILDTSYLSGEDATFDIMKPRRISKTRATVLSDILKQKTLSPWAQKLRTTPTALHSPISGSSRECDAEDEISDAVIMSKCESLLSVLRKSTIVVFQLTSTDNQIKESRKSKLTKILQISFVYSENKCQWETFQIPLCTGTSIQYEALVCYKKLLKACIEKRMILSNCKEIFTSVVSSRYLSINDLLSIDCCDICLAKWLLDTDCYKENCTTMNTVDNSTPIKSAKVLLNLWNQLYQQLIGENLLEVYKLEVNLVPVLISMQENGIAVDEDELNRLDQLMKRGVQLIEKEANALVGCNICINSHVQLRQVLFDKLKLGEKLSKASQLKTSKNKVMSTSEPVLTQLSSYHRLPALILKYRQLFKVHSTYVSGIKPYINNGILRTHWDQTSATTGRLQSSKPNIQAVPKTSVECPTEQGTAVSLCVRSVFKARAGYTLLSVDFKQVEFRIFAHMTNDQKLIDILKNEKADIFINLTSVWMNKGKSQVTESDRERTKRIVYSVMYGVGKYTLSQHLAVTPMEAQSIMSRFLREFPGIQRFSNEVITKCKSDGFATSILGRKRKLADINDKDFKVRSQCERQAVNFTIQGSAADICKVAMKAVMDTVRSRSIDAKYSFTYMNLIA